MKGIGTSPGIGIGKIFVYSRSEIVINPIKVLDTSKEIDRFNNARYEASLEIDKHRKSALEKIGEDEAEIFTAHLMMLEDPELISTVNNKIKEEQLNAEYAVNEVISSYLKIFDSIEDEYLRARAADLSDVAKTLIEILLNTRSINLSQIEKECIIVAEDLTPYDMTQINKDFVVGIVTELGGRTSHISIIARTLEIPIVCGLKGIVSMVNHGDLAIINGDTGDFIINPSEEKVLVFQNEKEKVKDLKRKLSSMRDKKSLSKDGYQVKIVGNIGNPQDVDKVLENGGEGVGLYRTEFLYMNRNRLPTEEEQFDAYRSSADKLGNKPLIIRTLDIGGDKELPYLNLPNEMNPFLGYRAIRLCLDRKDIFETQLRAILRASAFGNVKLMLPMISSINEVRESKIIISKIKDELRSKNVKFNENLEIGIMVEIPAVAIHSRAFAKEVDFFSIGTNDLIQYTLAVDRGNQEVSHLYNQYHPAVLNLIKLTIENGHKEGIMVNMCGEAAGDEKLIPVLLAMGLDEFSMSASSILKARFQMQGVSIDKISLMLDKLLSLPTAEDVESFIDKNII